MISKNQNDFQDGCSTSASLSCKIQDGQQKGFLTGVILHDLTKDFDNVSMHGLICKLNILKPPPRHETTIFLSL